MPCEVGGPSEIVQELLPALKWLTTQQNAHLDEESAYTSGDLNASHPFPSSTFIFSNQHTFWRAVAIQLPFRSFIASINIYNKQQW